VWDRHFATGKHAGEHLGVAGLKIETSAALPPKFFFRAFAGSEGHFRTITSFQNCAACSR
jgi:hypothetical protein